jgi:mannosyl-3-phosphoglycerate phosphatase
MTGEKTTIEQETRKPIVFTDLDGTLLETVSYSYQLALETVKFLKANNIPIIFCSAKTREEQEYYRKKLQISDPFIVENGGAIFIPRGYFNFELTDYIKKGKYNVIELGIEHDDIISKLKNIKATKNINIKGFADMTIGEISAVTGLNEEMAKRARSREYDETILPCRNAEENEAMLSAIKIVGLNYTTGGRFYEVMGSNDKGVAINQLSVLFRKQFGRIITAGIGDNLNDLPMLKAVDRPYLVQLPNGTWEQISIKGKKLHKVQGIGPEGWIRAVKEFIGFNINH